MIRRMPRMQVYLPDDLYEQLKTRRLPASKLLQEAVRAELRRQDLLGETDSYLAELLAEVGEPSPEERTRARPWPAGSPPGGRRRQMTRSPDAGPGFRRRHPPGRTLCPRRRADRSPPRGGLVATGRPLDGLVECLTGAGSRDAAQHRFLRACESRKPSRALARRAAWLRRGPQGSAVEALVTATAEPGGTVLTGNLADLQALAGHASDVAIEAI